MHLKKLKKQSFFGSRVSVTPLKSEHVIQLRRTESSKPQIRLLFSIQQVNQGLTVAVDAAK